MNLTELLGQRYDKNNYIRFVNQFFLNASSYNINIMINSQYSEYIKECSSIAKYVDNNGKSIAILATKVADNSRARTIQRNFIAKLLSNGELTGFDGALVAFYDEVRSNWKLALVTIDYNLIENNIEVSFNPAKRFSFLVGVGEPNKTYISQLRPIYDSNVPPTFEEIKEAFSVSKVTKDFYEDYCDCFDKLSKYLIQNIDFIRESSRLQYDDVKEYAITFTKKTLGQIVFLHFLQKKGWLGVPVDKTWGDGDKNYIYNSIQSFKGENYFNDFLEPLFYEALNSKRNNDVFNGVKIPFLNGGLFSPIENYNWKNTNFNIPNEIWFNKDKKGFLDILHQYNFTIDESDPTEQDIAVDPEMLGRIFESLLDPDERHDKGAHYTPREIVHFMCIEALSYRIASELKMPFESIKNYILYGNSLGKKEDVINKNKDIDSFVSRITIVDPAVGSGAFLVGMLNEITKLRMNLAELRNEEISKYDIKENAIRNSLYGVDIENDAIEIAKLRLWLSLIVDQEAFVNQTPKPLPNLMYQLRVGNSLVDEYHGVKLWDKSVVSRKKKIGYGGYNIFNFVDDFDVIQKKIKEAKDLYFTVSNEQEKINLYDEISKWQLELIKNVLFNKDEYELFNEVQDMMKKRTKPFFLWQFEFDRVFDNGGFDIVIANPPYIQLQSNQGKLAKELENQGYETFARTGDIYCIFYEQAINLLKKDGVFAFITSNKWMRAGYGEKLRGYLAKNTNPLLLVDFGGVKVFESATVDVNVLVASKSQNLGKTKATLVDDTCTDLLSVLVEQANIDSFSNSSSWIILNNSLEQSIIKKVNDNGTKLSDWDINIYYGIKTGLNDAFIIDETTKNQLILDDPKSAELIRPLLRGRDIKRYGFDNSNLYMIIPHNGIRSLGIDRINIDDYPAIKSHLDKYYDRLLKRYDKGDTPYNLRSCDYMDEFNKQKIMYSEIVQKPQFYYDNGYFVPEASTFFLTGKYLKYLCIALNSKVVSYIFKKYYAGGGLGASGFRYKKKFLINLPIVIPSPQDNAYFEMFFDEEKYNDSTELKNIENKIMDLYHFNDEEKEYILDKITKDLPAF